MRKILIDETVRAFAEKYAYTMKSSCNDVVNDLKTLRDNLIKFNKWVDEDGIKEYFDTIISDYPKLLILEPKDWELEKYTAIENKNKNFLKKKVVYAKNSRNKPMRGSVYKRIMFCLRYTKARLILGRIHQEMGLRACIYCNTISLEASNDEVSYEMDHYKPQSEFPYLGTCFYNLQPCDSGCNKRKSKKFSNFGLYVNEGTSNLELSPFMFHAKFKQIGKYQAECLEIEFLGKKGMVTDESIAHDDTFHIHKKYINYRQEAANIYEKAVTMNENGRKAREEVIGYKPSRNDYIKYILDAPYDESLIHSKPLNKLKFDIFKDLDDNNVLKI